MLSLKCHWVLLRLLRIIIINQKWANTSLLSQLRQVAILTNCIIKHIWSSFYFVFRSSFQTSWFRFYFLSVQFCFSSWYLLKKTYLFDILLCILPRCRHINIAPPPWCKFCWEWEGAGLLWFILTNLWTFKEAFIAKYSVEFLVTYSVFREYPFKVLFVKKPSVKEKRLCWNCLTIAIYKC